MGFKRTTDGRVFFQGAQGSANDAPAQKNQQQEQRQPLTSPQGGQSQLQILTLLKSLNDRLKTTQAERNYMRKQLESYREVIEGLEDKADRNEQAFKVLEQSLSENPTTAAPQLQRTEELMKETLKEMAQTRKLMLDVEDKAERADRNVASLQQMQQEQAQRMAKSTAGYAQIVKRLKESENKQDDLGLRLEETASEQAKLTRKVDKAVEDRARFMRKIERIEETVIQTRDALNAKAMVLLTDQGAGAVENLLEDEQTLGDALLKNNQALEAEKTLAPEETVHIQAGEQQKSSSALGVFIALLLIGAGAVGWIVSQMDISLNSITPQQEAALEAPSEASLQTPERAAPPEDWRIERNTDAFAEAPQTSAAQDAALSPAQNQSLNALDDIGAMNVENEQDILNLLEDNPDAVGEALNEIEPGSIPSSNTEAKSIQQASIAPQQPSASTSTSPAESIASSYNPIAPSSALKPDSALPDVIKQVEEQAFAGSAEAQHDLAAIYTAGHGGVKQDYSRASHWFRKAADQGIANARYNLGVLYHQGLGVKTNMKEAMYWYEQASVLGHPEAQYNLGIAYIEGIGVPYNPQQAASYFEQAANGGVMEAAYNLGLIYENGLLGQAKPDVALMWYKVAADQGSPEAKTALEQLAKALDIKLEDVNRLVEGMRTIKGGELSPPASAPQPKAQETKRVESVVQPAPQQVSSVPENIIPAPVEVNEVEVTRQEIEQMMVAQVQEQLMRIGLYPGPADGRTGMLTSDAIRSYQSESDLPVNGIASNELLSHMLVHNDPTKTEQGSRAQ